MLTIIKIFVVLSTLICITCCVAGGKGEEE